MSFILLNKIFYTFDNLKVNSGFSIYYRLKYNIVARFEIKLDDPLSIKAFTHPSKKQTTLEKKVKLFTDILPKSKRVVEKYPSLELGILLAWSI